MPVKMCWCIGEDQYEDVSTLSQLKYAESSAHAIADCAVEHLGFDKRNVYVMTNRRETSVTMKPTYANIKRFAERVITEVGSGALSIDTLVVYVGVHGYLNQIRGNKRYLCLRSTRTDELDGTALSYAQLLEWLLAFKARDTIVIGDSCQELTISKGSSRDQWVSPTEEESNEIRSTLSVRAPRTFRSGQTRPNLVQIDACGPGELTYDGLYANQFVESVKQLACESSRVTIGQISRLTAEKIARSAYGDKCHPRYTNIDGCGDVCFLTNYVEQARANSEQIKLELNDEPEQNVGATDSIAELLILAGKALDEKRYADAKYFAERVLALDPEDYQAVCYVETALREQKKADKLQEDLRKSIKSGWKAVAEAKVDEQQWLVAFRFANEALALDPKDKDAVRLRQSVEAPAKEVERKNRLASIQKLLTEGVELFKSNQWDEASTKADAILEIDPQYANALKLKNACRKKLEERERAQKFVVALAEGERLLKAERYFEASAKIEEILQLDPTNMRALDLRGRVEANRRRRWLSCKPGEKLIFDIQDFRWTFIYCPPTGPDGFMMGAPKGENGRYADENLHKVILTQPAFLMDAPITQGQYAAIMGINPSHFRKGDDFPVEGACWNDFQWLANKLNGLKSKLGVPSEWYFSLPSEALWEYACREFGENRSACYTKNVDECAWYESNSEGGTHEVRGKKANKYGFYDMLGNVWEWCYDSWNDRLTEATDPCYDEQNADRVRRGGSWYLDSRSCRAACRRCRPSSNRSNSLGARLAIVIKR